MNWGRKLKAKCKWCDHPCQTEIYSESASCDNTAACRGRIKMQKRKFEDALADVVNYLRFPGESNVLAAMRVAEEAIGE